MHTFDLGTYHTYDTITHLQLQPILTGLHIHLTPHICIHTYQILKPKGFKFQVSRFQVSRSQVLRFQVLRIGGGAQQANKAKIESQEKITINNNNN